MPASSAGVVSDEEIVFQGGVNVKSNANTPLAATREPLIPEDEVDEQKLRGFAHFIKCHSSPRHQRVTAGGRIVPAEPNSPPPTFHMAFLEDFVGQQNENNTNEPCKGPHTPVASQQHDSVAGDPTAVASPQDAPDTHPALRIPFGFQVLSTSEEGTVAITHKGNTVIEARLAKDGNTKYETIKPPMKTSNATFGGGGHERGNMPGAILSYPTEPQPVSTLRRPQLHQTSVPPGTIANAQINQPMASHFSQAPIRYGMHNHGYYAHQRNLGMAFMPQQPHASHTTGNPQPPEHPFQVPGNHHHPSSDPYQGIMASIKTSWGQKSAELVELERYMASHTYFLSQAQAQHLAQQKHFIVLQIDELRRQMEWLETVEQGKSRCVMPMNPHPLSTTAQPCQKEERVFPQSKGLAATQVNLSEHIVPLAQETYQSNLFSHQGMNPMVRGNGQSTWALSPTAPTFVPQEFNDSSLQSKTAPEHGAASWVARDQMTDPEHGYGTSSAAHQNQSYEACKPLQTDNMTASSNTLGGNRVYEIDAAERRAQAAERNIMDGYEEFEMEMKERIDQEIEKRRIHDPLRETHDAIVATMPWTWGRMPGETKDMYEDRLAKRHKANSQGRGLQPRMDLSNENAPLQAYGMVTKEPEHSAANALAAAMRRESQRSSVGIRGGNTSFTTYNGARSHHHTFHTQSLPGPHPQQPFGTWAPSSHAAQGGYEVGLGRTGPYAAVPRRNYQKHGFVYGGPSWPQGC